MFVRPLRRLLGATLLLVAVILAGCSGGATSQGQTRAPLKILSAAATVSPAGYSGPCGAEQHLTFSATLTANANNTGGTVHYLWTVNHVPAQGDVTFAPGESTKVVTTTLAYTVPADADSELRASFATTAPNSIAAADAVFKLACTVPFQIVDLSVTMQPWSAGCGPHTFGWAAVITAPANNVGGTVHYVWTFRVGGARGGTVTFAPGQVTQVVTTAQTYTVVPAGTIAPPPSPFPVVTPTQIYGALSIDAPNSISDFAVQDHSLCTSG